jgi:predicted O-methyltransferase YrrM
MFASDPKPVDWQVRSLTRVRQSLESARAAARVLLLGGNMAALSLARSPRQMLTYASENLFLFRSMSARRGIKESNVFEVLEGPAVRDITLGNLHGQTWLQAVPSYTADIVALCLICQALQPRVVFEIGTLHGYTALHFALNTPDEALIYTLDLPQDRTVEPALRTTMVDDDHIRAGTSVRTRVFEGTEAAGKIRPLFGDSATFDYTPYHAVVDFFFIDGAHSYDYVASDTRNAFECVRPGGLIAWHDFGRAGVNGVSRLVREVARARPVHVVPGGSLAFTVV